MAIATLWPSLGIKPINHEIMGGKVQGQGQGQEQINHEGTKGEEVRLRPKTYKIIL